jgi:putative intracellular protease/amidase
MRGIVDFLAGRSNKLLRDFMGAGLAITAFCFGALLLVNTGLEQLRETRGLISLPPKISRSADIVPNEVRTVTRSVLDDNLTTGSTRPIILDPCTGKEKK